MASGGLTCAKFITFFWNLLFGLTGLAIFAVGAIVHFTYAHYSNFLGDSFWTTPIVLMIVGAIISFICFLGCCGAIKENSCMILSFVILAALIFLTEIGLGIAAAVQSGSLMTILDQQFNYTIKEYNNRKDFRDTWGVVQAEFKCCGKNSYEDWSEVFTNGTLPDSCCPVINLNDSPTCIGKFANNEGCLNKLWKILDEKTVTLASLTLGIAGIQVLTILFACCLFRTFRRSYETV